MVEKLQRSAEMRGRIKRKEIPIKEEKTTSEKKRGRLIKDKDEDKEFGKENQMWRHLMNRYMDIFGKSFDYHF